MALNKLFLDISKNCPEPVLNNINLACYGPSGFFLEGVTPWEISDTLRTTYNPFVGCDEIHDKALRVVKDLLWYHLSHLINESFKYGEFPEPVKKSKSVLLLYPEDINMLLESTVLGHITGITEIQ